MMFIPIIYAHHFYNIILELSMPSYIIFCKTLVKGGAEKQAITLAKLLTKKGLNIILVSWCGDKIDIKNLDYIRANSIKYIGLRGNQIKKLSDFYKLLNRENVTMVLAYLTLANFVAGICKLFNKKFLSVGGIRTEKLPYYKFIFERFMHNHLNDATVFNNYSAKIKFVRRGFNPEKIYVIHNAIDLLSSERGKSRKDGINIISVSRFVKSKDYKTALSSFKKLTNKYPGKSLKYKIVGYGPMEGQIRSLISQGNLDDKVELLINPPNIPDILARSDIYLSTSLYEGLSNSIMEAMVNGLSIVATDVGDNSYLVQDGYNGYLAPVKDTDQLFEQLESLIKSEEQRAEFGKNSQEIIKHGFTEENLLNNYYTCFPNLSIPK